MCAYGVQLNLSRLPGVEQCDVSYEDQKATLVFAPGVEPDLERIKATVVESGYIPGAVTVRDRTD